MRYIKIFEKFEEIHTICGEYGIKNYTINPDGSIDVDGHINLDASGIKKLPIKFGVVTGDFDCSYNNQLTTLEGCPKIVGGAFSCTANKLTNLSGCPESVGGDFYCNSNKLTTLVGCPKMVGLFDCRYNQLINLVGSPEVVNGDFDCTYNKIITLDGIPDKIGGCFDCDFNPITEIYCLFPDHEDFMQSLDWNYLRGNKIVKSRFKEACEELNISMPKIIQGYKYI